MTYDQKKADNWISALLEGSRSIKVYVKNINEKQEKKEKILKFQLN